MDLHSVVLPAPLGPMMTVKDPFSICRLMFRRTRSGPLLYWK